MSLDLFIIFTYCWVDAELRRVVAEKGGRLRQRGPSAALTDAEALAMGLVGESLGLPSSRRIWQYFRTHWSHYFPNIPSRCNFTRQLANLDAVKRAIFNRLSQNLAQDPGMVFIVDGVPMPLCELCRAKRSRRFPLEAGTGYCATKKMYYFGLKGHVVIDDRGTLLAFSVASPHEDERAVFLNDCAQVVEGHEGVADKGYIGQAFHEELWTRSGINLSTPLRKNMKNYDPDAFPNWMKDFRRKVETVIGHLVDTFKLTTIRSYKPFQFMSRVVQKLLAYNLSVLWLRFNGIDSLELTTVR